MSDDMEEVKQRLKDAEEVLRELKHLDDGLVIEPNKATFLMQEYFKKWSKNDKPKV